MKAIVYERYGEPDVLKVAEVDKPSIKENEVLVEVKASGVNPVDTYFRKGIREVPSFPFIPHLDLAGVVVEVGKNVKNVKVGDRIWATNANSASAEYTAIDANLAFPLHNDLSFIEGAALAMPFMTAHLSLFFRGKLESGETVFVFGGAGSVGHAAIQLAKARGARVIATAGNEEKAEIARQAGADDVILYKEEDVVERTKQLTDNEGVDIILDMSVSENLEKDLHMIKLGGRIVTIGSPVNNTPTLPWRLLNLKHATLLGMLQLSAPLEEIVKAGKEISDGFEKGIYKPYVGKVFPFAEASEAHRTLEQKTVNGRIILDHQA